MSCAQNFQLGDSALPSQRNEWAAFFAQLTDYQALNEPWTLILQDPLANSFISPITEDLAADPRLTLEDYVRSAEEDEDFGIAHLRAQVRSYYSTATF